MNKHIWISEDMAGGSAGYWFYNDDTEHLDFTVVADGCLTCYDVRDAEVPGPVREQIVDRANQLRPRARELLK